MSHYTTHHTAATHAVEVTKVAALQAKLAADSHATQNHYQVDAHYEDGTGMITAKAEIHIGGHVTCNGQETVVYNQDYGYAHEGYGGCQVEYNW